MCFPHAGSGPAAYRDWAEAWEGVEVCAVQLPGHGVRRREPPLHRMTELARALSPVLGERRGRPLAFFGHSMGGLLAFEVARELRRLGVSAPQLLAVSGVAAPQRPRAPSDLHRLPEPELVRWLAGLDGTPREVTEHAELMQALLPAFRADLAAVETYAFVQEPPLRIPIAAFGGREDPFVSRADLSAWREQTRGRFSLRILPGGHFFVESARPALLSALGGELEPLLARRGQFSPPPSPAPGPRPPRPARSPRDPEPGCGPR